MARKVSIEGSRDLPFAKELFESADRLRGSVESAEYKHLVLGLLFLKYISDAFARRRGWLDSATRDVGNRDYFTDAEEERQTVLDDRDEYISENVFWVPEAARFPALLAAASLPDIGERIDKALDAIESDNPEQLRSVLPRIYARAPIQPAKLGELVGTIARIGFGDDPDRARDVLGRTYEYFIKEFARSEGHRGGEFYTPASVTRLLVEMLEPFEGRVLDPACGSGGLFVQSAEFVKAHGGRPQKISILGQENNQATWRICRMNLAIHGLTNDVKLGDSLLDDKFAGGRADFVMANPPFNMKKWGATSVAKDARWTYGEPPDGNANFAWIQHFIHHLAPDGRAGFVMANGSLTSNANGEGDIRRRLIEADLIDCIVALPGQLFFTTPVSVSLWFIERDKSHRARPTDVLFIDARAMGEKITRTQIELSAEEIGRITHAYHAWRETDAYSDEAGLSVSVSREEIVRRNWNLNPVLYVPSAAGNGSANAGADGIQGLISDLRGIQSLITDVERALSLELPTERQDWTRKKLSELVTHKAGKQLPRSGFVEDGAFVVYGSNSIMGRTDRPLYEGPMSVMARIGSNCGALRFTRAACWVNNNASALVARDDVDPLWLHHTLLSLDMTRFRRGSGQPFIGVTDLLDTEVLAPPQDEQRAIGSILAPLFDLGDALDSTASDLEAVLGALAHRLLFGVAEAGP